MKKQFFTFLMMIALVIVAGSAMAQTSVTPFVGSTYNYSVTGIDGPAVSRTARIYFTTDAAPTVLITPETASGITISNVTKNGAVTPNTDQGGPDGDYHVLTLDASVTSISFNVTYGSSVATGAAHRIWIQIFDDNTTTTCNNMMYLNVTPAENTLDFAIAATDVSKCPSTTVPTAQQTDAVDNTTTIEYTISRIDGNTAYDWAFNLGVTPANFGPSSQAVTVSYSAGLGSIVSGSGFGAEIRVRGTESVTATITVTNNPGTVDTDFDAALTSMQQYFGTTATVNSTNNDVTTNDDAKTTLKRIPSIGGFVGN